MTGFVGRIAIMGICLFALCASAGDRVEPPDLILLRDRYYDALAPSEAENNARISQLKEKYVEALYQIKASVMSQGDLDSALALDQEIKRMIDGRDPDQSEREDLPQVVRNRRIPYERARDRILKTKGQQQSAITTRYLRNLSILETKLTKAGDLEGALRVRREREQYEEVAAASPAGTEFVSAGTPAVASSAAPPMFTSHDLNIRAFIDGADTMKIQDTRVWFIHNRADLPGKWQGRNEPTYIGGAKWFPKWNGNESEPYTQLDPPFRPRPYKKINVRKKEGRGSVEVIEQPRKENDFTLTLYFDDLLHHGAAWYDIDVKW